MKHYVYIISHGTNATSKSEKTFFGPVKIGRAANPCARVKALQTGNPNLISLFYKKEFNSLKFASDFEKRFHAERANESGLVGEWYGIEPEEALQIIEGM